VCIFKKATQLDENK